LAGSESNRSAGVEEAAASLWVRSRTACCSNGLRK
jgi:hypothetical protein